MTAVQFDMFAPAPAASMLRERHIAAVKHLRPYQQEAVRRIQDELSANRSTLLVLPTGTGKTRTFSEVVKEHGGPVLVVAHRDELISQGRAALEENTGELVSTEKAELHADGTRIVVASVQTLKGERLASFARRHPASLVVVDEAHHAVSQSYRAIFDAYPEAKLLGVTATPDRSDERAMGQVFDSVAFVYEIRQAIADGYLCPIRIKQVHVQDIDLSHVGTVAGDLNQGELDAVMKAEAVIHGIVAPSGRGDSLIELAGERRAIVFCTSVDAAHRTAEIINRYRPDAARAVDGGTATRERHAILRDHKGGRYQFLCNVGVLTEGYDDPAVACVAMCRPTKSRALYAQCVGRGLRPVPGKPDCLVLDFVGNSGKHRLASALDVLDGKWDDEVVEKARDILEAQGMDGMLAEDALEQAAREVEAAKAREAAKRLKVKAKGAKRIVVERDPFAVLGVKDPAADPWAARFSPEATPAQVQALVKFGVDVPEGVSAAQAHKLMDACVARRERGLATFKQVRLLKRYGIDGVAWSFAQAHAFMGALAQNNWRPLDAEQLARVTAREPGMEG
jgi:superfamily II DNA or RNA helicase